MRTSHALHDPILLRDDGGLRKRTSRVPLKVHAAQVKPLNCQSAIKRGLAEPTPGDGDEANRSEPEQRACCRLRHGAANADVVEVHGRRSVVRFVEEELEASRNQLIGSASEIWLNV